MGNYEGMGEVSPSVPSLLTYAIIQRKSYELFLPTRGPLIPGAEFENMK